MSTVLVVQPDEVQADVLRSIFAKRVGAELVMVDSTTEAVDEIAGRIPDLILLSAHLSPRDEDALIAHLRSLEGASHLQTITIPQFRTGAAKAPEKKGGLFRKKSKAPAPSGPTRWRLRRKWSRVSRRPAKFAIGPRRRSPPSPSRRLSHRLLPSRASRSIRRRHSMSLRFNRNTWRPNLWRWSLSKTFKSRNRPSHSWWRPLQRLRRSPLNAEPFIEDVIRPVFMEEVIPPVVEDVKPLLRVAPKSIEIDDIDRLARELGLDLKYVDRATPEEPTPVSVDDEDVFDFGASLDRARNAASRQSVEVVNAEHGLDAEAIREAAIAEARVSAEREAREAVAADLARVQAQADAMREAAIAEARAAEARRDAAVAEAREAAERAAREAVAADLARVQAQAEAMREAAIAEARVAEARREAAVAEAREAAERAAREKLDAELERMRAETEVTVAAALNKVKLETEEAERLRAEEARLRAEEAEHLRAEETRLRAEEAERVRAEAEIARAEAERIRLEALEAQEAFAAELARVRAEVEQSLAAQLDSARVESERMRAAEAATARERAAAEAQLKAELDRLKFVATQTRKADESEVRRATDQIKQLEGELARVHAQAEERQAAQLEELRTQMVEMREAAAHQARTAAAEAVASEVARATAQSHESTPRRLNVVRMQPRVAAQEQPSRSVAARDVAREIEEAVAAGAGGPILRGRLLQPLSEDDGAAAGRGTGRRRRGSRS